MWKYILAHWRGEHGFLRSCLWNGLVLNILIFGEGVGFYTIVYTLMKMIDRAPMDYRTVCLIWAILWASVGTWACVGIFRYGIKQIFDRTNTNVQRITGTIAIAWTFIIGLETAVPFVAAARGYLSMQK
jgi:hypothetical protein